MKSRSIFALAIALAACTSQAADGTIILTAFPTVAVADNRSSVTITAEIRDGSGKLVPDGTQVLFETSLGSFRESIVTTVNGYARGTLVAGSVAGVSSITASALAYRATSRIDFEFVGSRSDLSSAKEYFEIYSPRYLVYVPDRKIVAAAGPNRSARFRYRNVEIEADDMQIKVQSYELRARNARIKIGSTVYEFSTLYLQIRSRTGFGTGSFELPTTVARLPFAGGGKVRITRRRNALVSLFREQIKLENTAVPPNLWDFEDLSTSQTQVSARRIVAYPQKDILFSKAAIYYADTKVYRTPLYQMSARADVPALSDQLVNVTNNQLAVDFPYYLSLEPGSSSLFRFRYGSRYSTSTGTANGTFLDYEMKWDKGDDFGGGLTINSLLRNDWGINLRQFARFTPNAYGSATINLPERKSLQADSNFNFLLGDWQANLDGSTSRSIRGIRFNSSQVNLNLERNPIKLKGIPARFSYGLIARHQGFQSDFGQSTQSAAGVRTRLQSNSLRIGKRGSLISTLSLSKLLGHRTNPGLTTVGNVTFSQQPFSNASMMLGYDYVDDAFNSRYLGRHRISSQLYWYPQRWTVLLNASRALDLDRTNAYASLGYRLSNNWRLATQFSVDRYLGRSVTDSSILLGYTVGFREIGVSWSSRTKRLGLEILGAPVR
ncbi:MAG: hypothetical protein JST40_06265 [Armatimonadetes bacterium]|nr:hypothetical protein [Armatimonadota bacterium]